MRFCKTLTHRCHAERERSIFFLVMGLVFALSAFVAPVSPPAFFNAKESGLRAWAQQKPFTRDQVRGLVRDGLGDESGAKLIEQRGIDFAPAEDFLQALKAAGASEAFLKALRAAKPSEPAAHHKTMDRGLVFLLAGPSRLLFFIRINSSEINSAVAGPNDLTQPVGLGLKLRMAEEPADETRCLVRAHCQTNDAVMGMAKRATVESQIACKERGAFDSVQERDDLPILHAWPPDLMPYLAGPNAPAAQQLPLIFRNILIKDVHLPAGTSSSW